MKGLVRKEVRSILPAWLLAMVLAILPVWVVWPVPQGVMVDNLGMLVFGPFALGVLVLSLTPFGQELNWGTFGVLLSQPIPRPRIWLVKSLTLAVALGCAFLALYCSNIIRVESTLESMKHTIWRNAFEHPGDQTQYFVNLVAETRRAASHDTLFVGGLAVMAGFAGGLWTTLLFRQVTAAFWMTLLAPMGLTVLAGFLLKSLPDAAAQAILTFLLIVYAAAGFFWAKRFFLRVQDTQMTGGVISLPNLGALFSRSGNLNGLRHRRPLRTLMIKEFQAQQVNVLIAGGLLLIHLAVVSVSRWGANYLATHQSIAMVLEMVPLLWLAMPLLIGSVAVAEERKLGTCQSNFCLPVSRFRQFMIKLSVVIALGLFFGAIVPLLVEMLGTHRPGNGGQGSLTFLGTIQPLLFLQVAGSGAITLLAFYGSTLTRNALQALGAGLLATVITAAIIVAIQFGGSQWTSSGVVLWRGPLMGLILLPVMLLVGIFLAFRNYTLLQPGPKVWLQNGVAFLAALLCVAAVTTTIYHRAWEAWLPEEPPHSTRFAPGFTFLDAARGPRQRTFQSRQAPKLDANGSQRAVLLPDGRLWLQQGRLRFVRSNSVNHGMIAWYAAGPLHTGFVQDFDWGDVAIAQLGCFGIKRDGSLWDLSVSEKNEQSPKQVGKDRDWSKLTAGWDHFTALKSDGTLWQWDSSQSEGVGGMVGAAPAQIGIDTDWVAVCDLASITTAIKSDGSVWRWERSGRKNTAPRKWLMSACPEPVSLTASFHEVAVVCRDGTLWFGGDVTNSVYTRLIGPGLARQACTELVPLGHDSHWKEARFVGWGKLVAIKRDGSLWEWDLQRGSGLHAVPLPPGMASKYEGWLAICADNNAYLALAADGSLCLWGDPAGAPYYDWDGPDPRRLLMPSRIKAREVANLSRE